jgi:hypothetical protein
MQKEIIEIVARLDIIQPLVISFIIGSLAFYGSLAFAIYQWEKHNSGRTDAIFQKVSEDSIKEMNMLLDISENLGALTERLNAEKELREKHEIDQEKLCDERHKDD